MGILKDLRAKGAEFSGARGSSDGHPGQQLQGFANARLQVPKRPSDD